MKKWSELNEICSKQQLEDVLQISKDSEPPRMRGRRSALWSDAESKYIESWIGTLKTDNIIC